MSKSVICPGRRARVLAPFLPRVVRIRPALESFESDFLTKVGSAFTLSARVAEGISRPRKNPRAAMICAATVNCTLVADIEPPNSICDVELHNVDTSLFQSTGRGRGLCGLVHFDCSQLTVPG